MNRPRSDAPPESMWSQPRYFLADLRRWKSRTWRDHFYMLTELGVWAIFNYRVARLLFLVPVPGLRVLTRLIGFFIFKYNQLVFRITLAPGVRIGPGFYMNRPECVTINAQASAGAGLTLAQSVLIGAHGLGVPGAPALGDNVYIGTGARLLGPIRVGNNVRIGANAVVTHDLPGDVTAVGVPARVIARRASPAQAADGDMRARKEAV